MKKIFSAFAVISIIGIVSFANIPQANAGFRIGFEFGRGDVPHHEYRHERHEYRYEPREVIYEARYVPRYEEERYEHRRGCERRYWHERW